MQVKLADFGESKQTTLIRSVTGTCLYMAPEMFEKSKSFTNKVDVYSFGIVLNEIFTSKPPYDGETFDESALIKGHRPQISKQFYEQINLLPM